MFSGKIAGTLREDMYIKVLLSYRSLFVHRVIWKMVTGKDPVHFIDHIDGNKSHNAFSNLREASSSQNGTNCKMRSNNVSGFKGVHFRKDLKLKPFVASVKINGKNKYLGAFRTPEEAHQAFKTAADLIYGEFSNHG